MSDNDPTGPPAAVVVEDLHTAFATPRGQLKAVDGVSFSVARGATLGVVGESGSGKSAMARSIMNLLPPGITTSTGRILIDGRDVRSLPRAETRHIWGTEVSMVFQDPMSSLNPVMQVGKQIAEGLRYHRGMTRRAALARATELLAAVGIADPQRRLREYPHQLSGGMRQRVMIAIALACEPRLLVADEPTTALDVTVQKQILDLLEGLRRQRRMAMILITHDLAVVAGRADEVAVMYAGRIVEQAPASKLFRAMRHPYTKALFESIPKIAAPSHRRLQVIPGRPPDLANPPAGCAFAPRCEYAQDRCHSETPALTGHAEHRFACFWPVGTPEGEAALAANRAAGRLPGQTTDTAVAVAAG